MKRGSDVQGGVPLPIRGLFQLGMRSEDLLKTRSIIPLNSSMQLFLQRTHCQLGGSYGPSSILPLFIQNRDQLVVTPLLRQNVSGGRIPIRIDTPMRVGTVLKEETQGLRLSIEHREMDGFVLVVTGHVDVYQFGTDFQDRSYLSTVATTDRIIEPGDIDPIDSGLQFRPTVKPVFARDYQLDIGQ